MIDFKLEELERRGRMLITEIVPAIGRLSPEGVVEVTEFINRKLETAQISLSMTRKETERMVRHPLKLIGSAIFMLLFVASLSGCELMGYYKPTEPQKQLNAQNKDAGRQIVERAVQPEIKEIGADVQANSKVLEDTLIGEPAVKKPYTHQASAEIRTVVVKEYDESKAPWYKRWAGTLISGIGTLALLAIGVARYHPATAAIANIIHPIAQSLVGMKQDSDIQPNDSIHIDKIQEKLTALTKLPVIGSVLEGALKKAHLEALVHSPEGADPAGVPPPAVPA